MPDLISRTLAVLRENGVQLAEGLTPAEFDELEDTFGFRFAPDHRALLEQALPVNSRWTDWRGDASAIRRRFEWPVEGIVFDVLENGFWPGSWGTKPADAFDVEAVARRELARWPRLVPLYGHRYIAADHKDWTHPSPVFSVYQTDVMVYGCSLFEYARNETSQSQFEVSHPVTYVPYWSDLAEGVEPNH